MNIFERHRLRKFTRQILHEASHARNMREDCAKPSDLQDLDEANQAVQEAWNSNDIANVPKRLEALSAASSQVYPPRAYGHFRENVEIFAVAIIIAMGFRSYFIQPFKIPTGSMQPTLYGIQVDQDAEPNWTDRIPFRYVKFLITGERYVEVRASVSGYVGIGQDKIHRQFYILVNPTRPSSTHGARHKFHQKMRTLVASGQYVEEGDLMARGMKMSGDHIFVDKVRYNFSKPKRGQIVVFRTELIDHPQIMRTDHYIKRLVGLPGEQISIHPPHLVVNNRKISEPYPFARLLEDKAHGYMGYTLARTGDPHAVLKKESDVLKLESGEFLPLGDNTLHSLDGRYFGAVPTKSIIGPAFAIYWPFNGRWGWVR